MVSFGIETKITGTEDLVAVANAVKAAGDKELRKDMLRGIRNAAKPAVTAIKEETRIALPLAAGAWYAGARLGVRTKSTGKVGTVKIAGPKRGKGADWGTVNDFGLLRHPTFGNREHWSDTLVESGFADRAADDARPEVVVLLKRAMDDTVNRIAAKNKRGLFR